MLIFYHVGREMTLKIYINDKTAIFMTYNWINQNTQTLCGFTIKKKLEIFLCVNKVHYVCNFVFL